MLFYHLRGVLWASSAGVAGARLATLSHSNSEERTMNCRQRFLSVLAVVAIGLLIPGAAMAAPATAVWNGPGGSGGTGNWDFTSPYWTINGTPGLDFPGNSVANACDVTFGGTPGTVTVTQQVYCDSLTFNVGGYSIADSTYPFEVFSTTGGSATVTLNGGTTTFTGTSSSSFNPGSGMLLTGSGTLKVNSLNGGTNRPLVLDSGTTLNLTGGSIPVQFSPTINAGAALDFTGNTATGAIQFYYFNLTGGTLTGTPTGGGYVTFRSDGVNASLQSGVISAPVYNSGSLYKTTNGTVTFNNQYGGTAGKLAATFYINGGAVAYGANNVIGNGTAQINNGATLNVNAFTDTLNNIQLYNGNIIGTGTLTSNNSSGSTMVSGLVSANLAGTAGLTVGTSTASAGTVTLSGNNTYGGTTSVKYGVLNIQNANALVRHRQRHYRVLRGSPAIAERVDGHGRRAVDAQRHGHRQRRCAAEHFGPQYVHRPGHSGQRRRADQLRRRHADP